MYKTNSTTLAWHDARTAALYFEKVIPAELTDLRRFGEDDPIYYKILWDLLPEELLQQPTKENVTGLKEAVTSYAAHYYVTFPETLGIKELPEGETFEERRKTNMPLLKDSFEEYVGTLGGDDLSIYGAELYESSDTASAEPSLVLSNLNLVDVSKLSWSQLLEFRKDEESREKLRALRRFISDSYSGKSKDFVRDELERQIEEYAEVTKFWDFPTRKSFYKIGLSSAGAAAVSDIIGLALFGAPIGTAIIGASTLIGTSAITVESRRREIDLIRSKNPVAYLVEAVDLCA